MSHLDPPRDPIGTFLSWYDEALRAGLPFADAMTLATATADGRPSARIVLYKGMVGEQLSFVSNFESRKGRELAANPAAALVFFWPALGRQVRFEGAITRAPAELSERYFRARDRESQLGAWASRQSEPIASRAVLEAAVAEASSRFAGRDVERPSHWGMYLLWPEWVELWISAEHRLHDRFTYQRAGTAWQCQRLAP
jgi:pyridoxamine 5'-phosphate oxidase